MNRYQPDLYKQILDCYEYETRNPSIYGNVIRGEWNLPKAAENCGLTNKEMKITFNEYCVSPPNHED